MALVFLLAVVSLASANVYTFPNISLYCANGGYASSDGSIAGAIAVNGNLNLTDFAIGSALSANPAGISRLNRCRLCFARVVR